MKLFKLYKWHTAIALFIVLLYGCQNNDPEPLFDDSPSVRVDKKIKEIKSFLQSSEKGWKVTYFTDNTQLGGYTFLFDFISDNEVTMDSDFGKADPSRVSLYNLSLGSTIKLSFTTKNVLHELSDGANYPDPDLRGQGYRGDFEFLFSSFDGDDIIFRVNRDTSIYLRFKRASAQDWVDLKMNKSIMELINGETLAYKIGDKTEFSSYNEGRRFAKNNDNLDLSFGVGFTPTGIIVSPAINANGTMYSEFTLSADRKKFVSSDGQFIIFILLSPVNMKQDWIINISSSDISDSFFKSYTKAFNVNKSRWNENLAKKISFGNTIINGNTSPGIMILSGGRYPAQYIVSFKGVFDEPTLLDISKVSGGFNWKYYTHLEEPLVNFIVNNAPYTTAPDPAIDPTVVKLISVADSNVWFIMRR